MLHYIGWIKQVGKLSVFLIFVLSQMYLYPFTNWFSIHFIQYLAKSLL